MGHPGALRRGEGVAGGGAEEGARLLHLAGGQVGDVDQRIRAGQALVQAEARDRVHPARAGQGDGLVPGPLDRRHDGTAGQAGPAEDGDSGH